MNKDQFLAELREKMSGLPAEAVHNSLEYYSEMIEDYKEEGLSEEEAVQRMPAADEIVDQLLAETSLPQLIKSKVKPRRSLKAWEIILLILGAPLWLPLLLALAAVVLAVYISIWAVIASLYVVDFSIALAAVAFIVGAFIWIFPGTFLQAAALFGAGLLCAGVAVLLFLLFTWISKLLLKLSKWMLIGMKRILVGKGEAK